MVNNFYCMNLSSNKCEFKKYLKLSRMIELINYDYRQQYIEINKIDEII